MKKCYKCKKDFPATSEYFYRNASRKDGLQTDCKECKRKHSAEYRRANPDYFREWNDKHPQLSAEYSRKSREKAKRMLIKRARGVADGML